MRRIHGWLGLAWIRARALGATSRTGAATVGIFGGVLTLVVFFWFQRGNDARFVEIFHQELFDRAELVKHASEQSLEDLGRLRRFMERESSVDRHEFSRISSLLVSGAYAVQAFEWIPCVPRSERAEWEARGRQAGFDGFRFTEKGRAGQVVAAGERDAYFPVWFVEPFAGNERAFGFDLGSEPMRRAALEKARDTGERTGTEPIRLIQETGSQRGFLVFEPVYTQGVSLRTVEERRARLRGFVLGVFRADDLLRSAVAHRTMMDLPMVVEDASASAHPLRYLSHHGSEFVPDGRDDGAALGWKSLPIEIAGREWRLHSAPTPAFVRAYRSREHWLVLPVGLLLTGLIALSLELLVSGRVRAEAVVVLKTAELRKAHDNLELRIAESDRAALALRQSEENLRAFFDSIDDFAFVLDEEGSILQVNRTVVRRLGYAEEDLIGRSVLSVHPEDRRKEAAERVAGMLSGKVQSCPVPLITRDGRRIPVETRVTPGQWNGRRVLFGISKDVSELHASEEKFAKSFHLNPLLMALSSVEDDRILDVNEAFLKGLGLAREEVLGKTSQELGLFVSMGERQAAFQTASKLGRVREVEMKVRTKSGKVLHGSFSAEIMELDGKKVLLTVMNDITERKRTEDLLKEVAERLALATRVGGVGIWDYDVVANRLVWDDQMFRLYGITRDQFGGAYEAWQAGLHPDDKQRGDEEIQLALRGKKDFDTEFRVLWPDGSTHHIRALATVQRDAGGRALRMVGTNWDLTERKRTEEELRKLWNAVESSPSAVMITDVEGKIEYVNPRFTEQTGWRMDEVVGQTPRILKSGKCPRERYEEMWRVLREGHPWRGEICNKRKDGVLYWESLAISPIHDARGRVSHFVAVRENITEKKMVAEELLRAKEAADEASRAKSTFLANMSHEIRTPMNAILGYAQILRRDPSLGEKAKAGLEIVNRSGEHLLTLINQVLDLSRIEAGRTAVTPSAFDLHSLLDDLVSLFRDRADAKMLEFPAVETRALPRRVIADHGKLRQMLINLLGNALKFTERGRICLKVSTRKEGEGLPQLVTEVEDTGVGISQEEMGSLFRPFEQTSSGRQLHEGTGLGLSISREYARLMGGDLSVTSQPGRGSIFRLVIPVREVGEEGATASPPRRVAGLQAGQPPVRVLIADDQPESRAWLKILLEQMGFLVREAVNGEEAVARWKTWKPHLILMDLRMPVLDGIQATRQIKEGDPQGGTAIFAVTAAVFEDQRRAILDAGAVEVLMKPLDENLLFDRIQAHLKVRFRYDATMSVPRDRKAARIPENRGADMSKLPEPLRRKMQEAIARGDSERLAALVRQVAKHHGALAKFLEPMVERYEYDQISRLLAQKTDR